MLKEYQTILFNLKDFSNSELDKKIKTFKTKYNTQLKKNGTIWIFCNNYLKKNEIFHSPFYIAEKFSDFYLKNIMITPSFLNFRGQAIFRNYITNILFFAKDEKYYFNKDPIREKHIWKDVEWGKRKKNYNPKGKDPGNVWLKTKDDGKANITEHCPLSFQEVVKRCYLTTSKKQDEILLINFKKFRDKKNLNYEKI